MGRIHLFEFEDQNWCPHFVREATTDFLSTYYTSKKVYEPAFEKISEVLEKTQTKRIIDCCSGSGGPIKELREFLDNHNQSSVIITLTDKYPNITLFEEIEAKYRNSVIAHKSSLDVTQIPPSLEGMRTLFSSFHHFKPEEAVKILQNAVDNETPIAIFEFTERRLKQFLRVLISPIIMLSISHFSKKRNWKRSLFTYFFPIIPFIHAWEYFVSNLRTYSINELHALTANVNAPYYQWEINKVWSVKAKCHITYLIGYKNLKRLTME